MSKAREAAARELCAFVADYFDKDPESFPIDKGVQRITDAFLAALKADGYKLVQREIDDAMFIAADNIMPRDYDELTIGMARYGEDVFYEVIPGPGKVWAAMWDAAPEVTTAPSPASQPDTPAK